MCEGVEHFICFEQEHYRRGRAPGEITALLRSELLRQGIEAHSIEVAPDYESGLKTLSAKAKPGDLVVVLGRLGRKELATLRTAFAPHPIAS
ncbi:MAG: hypothetical protein WED13_01480 [Methyloceanibacter sp.]